MKCQLRSSSGMSLAAGVLQSHGSHPREFIYPSRVKMKWLFEVTTNGNHMVTQRFQILLSPLPFFPSEPKDVQSSSQSEVKYLQQAWWKSVCWICQRSWYVWMTIGSKDVLTACLPSQLGLNLWNIAMVGLRVTWQYDIWNVWQIFKENIERRVKLPFMAYWAILQGITTLRNSNMDVVHAWGQVAHVIGTKLVVYRCFRWKKMCTDEISSLRAWVVCIAVICLYYCLIVGHTWSTWSHYYCILLHIVWPWDKDIRGYLAEPTCSWLRACRWPWCFGGSSILTHKMNVSISRGKTRMILTLSHPNMTRVGENRPFSESHFLFSTSKESSELLQEWVWIVIIGLDMCKVWLSIA